MLPPRIPIVLHHGMFGYRHKRIGPWHWDYFQGIEGALADRGHPLIFSQVDAIAPVARRAEQLKDALAGQTEPVLIIAHSMGGLDARYMISRLGMAGRVAALLTVSAPHHGSPYADWVERHLNRLNAFTVLRRLGMDARGVGDMTTMAVARFNREVPDAPGVRYFSIAAACPPRLLPPWARHSHRIIAAAQGDNDGLVAVQSAKWGEHLATWPVHHWQTINHHWLSPRKGDVTPLWLAAVDQILGRI